MITVMRWSHADLCKINGTFAEENSASVLMYLKVSLNMALKMLISPLLLHLTFYRKHGSQLSIQ